jgi:hypothetical protein
LKNQKNQLKKQLKDLKNKAYQVKMDELKKRMSKNVAGPSTFLD